jgi:hypothetical protein
MNPPDSGWNRYSPATSIHRKCHRHSVSCPHVRIRPPPSYGADQFQLAQRPAELTPARSSATWTDLGVPRLTGHHGCKWVVGIGRLRVFGAHAGAGGGAAPQSAVRKFEQRYRVMEKIGGLRKIRADVK